MKAYFIIFSLLLASVSLAAISVGVSPPIVDVGKLEPGEAKVVSFDFITSSEETLLVYMSAEKGKIDFFKSRPTYTYMLSNYSEEDTSSWVNLINNPIELKKPEGTGSNIRGRREVKFLLEIPEDAEPGYHLLNVIPTPTFPSESVGAAGAVMVSIVPVSVIFEIEGSAKRAGVILDTVNGGYDGSRLKIDTYFQNTGTNTMTVRSYEELYDKDGNFIASSHSQKALLEPNEVTVLNTYISTGPIDYDDYIVSTKVDYTTGMAYKNSTISLYSVPVAPMAVAEPFPLFTIGLIILLVVIIILIIRKMRD